MKKILSLLLGIGMVLAFATPVFAAPKPWDRTVHAPLKTAQPKEWSAPDEFFTGDETGSIWYTYESNTFKGTLELSGFKQAGPYALTVDTADGNTLADYDCSVWKFWAEKHGETFVGGTNGCWSGNPYADVKLFTLEPYIGGDGLTYYKGTIPFDVPLLEGTYNLKFFVKLDWNLTSPSNNIMMMNDMTGDPQYGKVVQPKDFNYSKDLAILENPSPDWLWVRIESGEFSAYDTFENLVLATTAWCAPGSCQPPSTDPGYQGTIGFIFYKKLSSTFEGAVVLSNTVTPPTPQPLQIKLEGLGSLGTDEVSNEYIGLIGRWWDNNTNSNINDATYALVKGTDNVVGYVIFDGFDTSTTEKTFSLNSSYHELWNSESIYAIRPTPGNVVMTDGDYKVSFALTENILWWRGVFMSENPLEFTIE